MILRSFTPSWHPSIAKNYFNLSNNVNQSNNIIYYDTTTEFINYPKTFYYKRTNSTYNFKLRNVTTNTSSGNPTYSPSLPASEGNFVIGTIVPDSGQTNPTIDLYFQGDIQKANIIVSARYDYDVPSPNVVSMGTPNFSFASNTGTFGSGQNVKVTWGRNSSNPTFSPSSFRSGGSVYYYRYTGDKISFTTNWNSEYKSSNLVAPSTPLEFTGPNMNTFDNIPTVYCNWEVIWDYPCSCNTDCSGYGTCSGYGGGSYQPWTATHLSGYYGYIRSEPSFNATVVQIYPISEQVTVSSKNGDWYYVTFDSVSSGSEADSGWCHKDGISGTDPNTGGGGGCVCDSDTCSSDCWDDICWEDTCTYHVPGCYCDDDYVCTSHACPRNF